MKEQGAILADEVSPGIVGGPGGTEKLLDHRRELGHAALSRKAG
jgi:hypothetical protein